MPCTIHNLALPEDSDEEEDDDDDDDEEEGDEQIAMGPLWLFWLMNGSSLFYFIGSNY